MEIVRELGPHVPLFGVCMGHQCIGQVFGGAIVRAPGGVMHGKTSLVYHNNTGLLKVRCRACGQCMFALPAAAACVAHPADTLHPRRPKAAARPSCKDAFHIHRALCA